MSVGTGATLARIREQFISRQGTPVALPGGGVRPALIKHEDHALLRGVTSDENAPEKKPVVFEFGGSAWGVVTENCLLTVAADPTRAFRVAPPLHPKWRQGVVTELAVVAWPD